MLTKTVDDDKEPSEKTTRETRRHQVLPNHAPAQMSNVVQQASPTYRSRETIRILAEAKSSFIQKGNFHDFEMEKKRERDPG